MNPSWAHPLGWALIHSVWQLGGLVLCYRAATALWVHRPRARYVAGLGILVLALLALVATFAVQRSERSAGGPRSADGETVALGTEHRPSEATVRAAAVPRSRVSDIAAAAIESQLSGYVLVWFAGICFVGHRFARSYSRSQALRDTSRPVTSRVVLDRLDRARAQMNVRRAVQVAESDELDAPVVVGWKRPRIIVPVAFARSLSPDHIEAILAHELAHVARRDYPVNLLQSAVERLFFFHPALIYLSREIRAAREQCCDDLAAAASAAGPIGYVSALVSLEEMRVAPDVALAASDGDLLRRVRRLLELESRDPVSTGASVAKLGRLGDVVAFACGALILACGVSALRTTTAVSTVLSGFDPVYLADGSEVRGSPSASLHIGGYRYLFAGPETMTRFLRAPERYTVQNRHFCPITGKPVRPDVWQVVDGRPMLFCCPMANAPEMRRVVEAFANPIAPHLAAR